MAKKILVVDDAPVVTKILKTHLEEHGFSVTSVSDGKQALEIVKTHPFDLIIMDVIVNLITINNKTWHIHYALRKP